MNGDFVNLTRAILLRLCIASVLIAIMSLVVFISGNTNMLSDTALMLALDTGRIASAVTVVVSVLALLFTFLSPFLGSRFYPVSLLVLVCAGSIGAGIFIITIGLKTIAGGISF